MVIAAIPGMPENATLMQDDIVARVNRLSCTLDRTVHRVEALRVAFLGLLAALAHRDPGLATAIMRDLLLVLDATVEETELQPHRVELDALRQDLRRELLAVVDHTPPEDNLP